jgi:hypothetical protein
MKLPQGQGVLRRAGAPVRLLWALVAALAAFGCEPYSRPNRPLPEGFRAKLLAVDGTFSGVIDRSYFEGRPWVVELWVPG